MKIQKGIVKYKDRNDIVCTYGVTDDGRQYYFLDETDTKKFSNGNRIATTALVEAVDPMVKASNVGVIDNEGNVIVMFDNRTIKPITDDVILVERAEPMSQSVIEALSLRSDPLSATKLVSTPATIKDRLNAQIGSEGRFIFNDQFSEATLCDINGNNLVNGEYYSFIAMTNDKIFMSKNTADSVISELPISHVDVLEESAPTDTIDVSSVAVDQNVVEGALAQDGMDLGAATDVVSSDVASGFNTDVQESFVAPAEESVVSEGMAEVAVPQEGEVVAAQENNMGMDTGVTDVMSSANGAYTVTGLVNDAAAVGSLENVIADPAAGMTAPEVGALPPETTMDGIDATAFGEGAPADDLQQGFAASDVTGFGEMTDVQGAVVPGAVEDAANDLENNDLMNAMAGANPALDATQPIDVNNMGVAEGSLDDAFASTAPIAAEEVAAAVESGATDLDEEQEAGELAATNVTDSTGFELPTDVVVNADEEEVAEGALPEIPVAGAEEDDDSVKAQEKEVKEDASDDAGVVVIDDAEEEVQAEIPADEDAVVAEEEHEEVAAQEEVPEVADEEEKAEDAKVKPAKSAIDDDDSFELPPVVEENDEEDEVAAQAVAVEEESEVAAKEEDVVVAGDSHEDEDAEVAAEESKKDLLVAEDDEANKPKSTLDDIKFDDVIVKEEVMEKPVEEVNDLSVSSKLTDLYDLPMDNADSVMAERGRMDMPEHGYYERDAMDSYGNDVYSIPVRGNTQFGMYNDGYDSVFKSSMIKPDRIAPSYNPFAGYKSSMFDSNSIMADVARSMTELMRQNKDQRGTILQYQQQLEAVEAQSRVLNEKYNDQTLRVESLSNKLRTLDEASSRLESKNQLLESRLHDQEKIIAAQERELNSLRPQLEGRQDLMKVLADAKALLGAEEEFQDEPYYGRRAA